MAGIQTKTLAVIGLKGGSGRSTLATNLAGELAREGAKVGLLDADMPQGTSTSWMALRQAQPERSQVAPYAAAHWRELAALGTQLQGTVDYLVIDTPPRIAEATRAALVLADLALVPCGASAAEIWATSDLVPLIADAKKAHAIEVRLVWSRFRAHTRLAQELEGPGAKELGLKPLRAHLALRSAYAQALGEGLTAAEIGDPMAREEIAALMTEIHRILR